MKRVTVLILALAICAGLVALRGQAQNSTVFVVNGSGGVVRAASLKDESENRFLSGSGNGAHNAAILNENISNRAISGLILVEGGGWDIEGTLGDGVEQSWVLNGSGAGPKGAAADSTWTGSGAGGAQDTRIYWNKRAATANLDRALIKTDAPGVTISDLSLRGSRRHTASGSGLRHLARLGEPTAWQAQSYAARAFVTHAGQVWQAGVSGATSGHVPGVAAQWTQRGYRGHVGIWHQTNEAQNGPVTVNRVNFVDLDIGIFSGGDTDIESAHDTGGWGDYLTLGELDFSLVDICVWVRSSQSVANTARRLTGRVGDSTNWASEAKRWNAILCLEYGNFAVDTIEAGNYRTILVSGNQPLLYPTVIRQVRLDGTVSHCRLYKAMHSIAANSNQYVIENFNVPNNWHNSIDAGGLPVASDDPNKVGVEPLVSAGPGKLILRNGTFLQPGCIKLTGLTSPNRLCLVRLENCAMSQGVDSIDELVHPDSVGPARIEWAGCSRIESSGNYRLRAFQDDAHEIVGSDTSNNDFFIEAP